MWWGAPDEPPLPRGDLLPQPPRPLQSSAVPVRGPWPTLTHHGGLQIDHDGPGHVLPVASLAEEGGEGVVVLDLAGLRAKSAIGLDAVLQAEELPAGIADLDPCLAHVDGYAFPLRGESSPVRAPARPRLCPRPPGPQAPRPPPLRTCPSLALDRQDTHASHHAMPQPRGVWAPQHLDQDSVPKKHHSFVVCCKDCFPGLILCVKKRKKRAAA